MDIFRAKTRLCIADYARDSGAETDALPPQHSSSSSSSSRRIGGGTTGGPGTGGGVSGIRIPAQFQTRIGKQRWRAYCRAMGGGDGGMEVV